VVLISFYVGIFYTVIIAYAVHYFILSFSSTLPWTTCNHTNSDPLCSEITFVSDENISQSTNAIAANNGEFNQTYALTLLRKLMLRVRVIITHTVLCLQSFASDIIFSILYVILIISLLQDNII